MVPNLQSIIITNAIGLALLFSLLVSSYMTRERRHLDDRIFTVLIFITAGSCVFEPITFLVDGTIAPWAVFLNYLGNTYNYIAGCLCPYLWVLYVDIRLHKGTERIHRWHPVVLVPTAVMLALIIGNLLGHYLFTISDANVYSRLPLSYLNYAIMVFGFVYSIAFKYRYQRKHGRVRFFPIAMFLVPIFIGAGLQAAVYGVSLAWPSVCIGLVSIHMSLQNELSYIDPLTNLHNRAYLDSTLETLSHDSRRFGGMMIDLDFFKDINDSFGHSTGDKALVDAAHVLVSAVSERALVVRYAGDEFVILLDGADEEECARVEHTIEEALAAFNFTSDAPYKLSMSIGYSAFEPGEDTINEFLHRIDSRMYERKRERHVNLERM